MAGGMGHFDYTSDDSLVYDVRLDASNASAAGFVTATVTSHLPNGTHMRYMWCESGAGKRRKVQHPTGIGDLWTGVTNTINLQEAGVAGTVAYTIRGRIGERRFDL